ncbi:hypothetical protein GUJ93_ZPchr0012g18920 [Zizania palustris]|uniref:Secreted protein n=1 Tax=Zizania palustris TaxID=103762 RepID=A0A8J5WUE8_ZIZPA|nr:hypothetical protein GUJ93_ZPchr0012g18920 [Zizania palustris]
MQLVLTLILLGSLFLRPNAKAFTVFTCRLLVRCWPSASCRAQPDASSPPPSPPAKLRLPTREKPVALVVSWPMQRRQKQTATVEKTLAAEKKETVAAPKYF